MERTIEEKVERFLYDLGGWSVGSVTERRRERLYALLDDAREQERIKLRLEVEDAMDVGIYPKSSPSGDRTPYQEGWNTAAMQIGDKIDALFNRLMGG